MTKPNDLLQGTLDLLVLKMLALEPMNGWAIPLRSLWSKRRQSRPPLRTKSMIRRAVRWAATWC